MTGGKNKPIDNNLNVVAERINYLAKAMGANSYLEIGVQNGNIFSAINIKNRTGIDQKLRCKNNLIGSENIDLIEVDSDTFFWGLPISVKYDIIYINNIHSFEQAYRDFNHAIIHSYDHSVFLINNTKPSDVYSSLLDPIMATQHREKSGNIGLAWHGDVFKIIFAIHDFHPSFNYKTIINEGNPQTLIWRSNTCREKPFSNSFESISRLNYFDLLDNLNILHQASNKESLEHYLADNGLNFKPLISSKKKIIIHGYFHVVMLNDWRSIFIELISQLIDSGLYAKCEKISLGLLGNDIDGKLFVENICELLEKIHIDYCHESVLQFEYPTLQLIKTAASFDKNDNDVYCFYLHTKGASANEERFNKDFKGENNTYENFLFCSDSWRKYMAYFIFNLHEQCIASLDNKDVVGVDLNENIFVGNFWWSKYSHIKKLPNLEEMQKTLPDINGQPHRFYAERWIGWYNKTSLGCLWISEPLRECLKLPFKQGQLVKTYYTLPILTSTYKKGYADNH